MNQAIRNMYKIFSFVIVANIILFLLVGCENDGLDSSTPFATYTFKGKITNQAGDPVSNMQIKITTSQYEVSRETCSDKAGYYYVRFTTLEREDSVLIIATTVDPINRYYQHDTIPVRLNKNDFIKDKNNWHIGSVHKEINIKLKDK